MPCKLSVLGTESSVFIPVFIPGSLAMLVLIVARSSLMGGMLIAVCLVP